MIFLFFLADKDKNEEGQDDSGDSGETQETDAVVSTHTNSIVGMHNTIVFPVGGGKPTSVYMYSNHNVHVKVMRYCSHMYLTINSKFM